MPASGSPSDDEAAASLRALVEQAAADLAARGARTEALARYKPARRIVVVKTAESLEPAGRAWRLGVLLLGTDGLQVMPVVIVAVVVAYVVTARLTPPTPSDAQPRERPATTPTSTPMTVTK